MPQWMRIVGLIVLVGILVAIIWASFVYSPEAIIEYFGPRWVYVGLFVVGLFGALSTFTSTPFYAALVVAIVGGLDPTIVALVVAPAVAIGDMILLKLLSSGVDALTKKAKRLARLQTWLERQPDTIIQAIVYLFFAFIPISADIFLTLVALTGIRPRKVFIYILLGNFTFFMLLGYLVQQGSPWVEKLVG